MTTRSRTTTASVLLAGALALAACGSDDDDAGERRATDVECGDLELDDVAEIIGPVAESGPTEGGGQFGDIRTIDAGCELFLEDGTGQYAVTAVLPADDAQPAGADELYDALLQQAEGDGDDRFDEINDVGDRAFVASAIGAVPNLRMVVLTGTSLVEVSSDLDEAPADLDVVEQHLRELAELAVDELF